jgi:hypothetical protein
MRILLLDCNLQRHSEWQRRLLYLRTGVQFEVQESIDVKVINDTSYDAYLLHMNNKETDMILDKLSDKARVVIFSGGLTVDLIPDDDYTTWWYVKLEYLIHNFDDIVNNKLLSGI